MLHKANTSLRVALTNVPACHYRLFPFTVPWIIAADYVEAYLRVIPISKPRLGVKVAAYRRFVLRARFVFSFFIFSHEAVVSMSIITSLVGGLFCACVQECADNTPMSISRSLYFEYRILFLIVRCIIATDFLLPTDCF